MGCSVLEVKCHLCSIIPKHREVIVFNGMGGAPGDPKAIEWYYANGIPSTGIKAATVPSAVSTLLDCTRTERNNVI